MKRTYLAASALIASQLLLSGCATTAIEANNDYAADLRNYGPNPLIKAPVLRDLEARMRAMAMASDSIGPEWGEQFNPRNQALLDNFSNYYNHAELMADIRLARAGFDHAVALSYPNIGSATECALASTDGYFFNDSDEPTRFDWRFVQGDCVDGLAHGIARVSAPTANAQFVGRFERGNMIEGIFTMQRQDGARTMQIGGVPRGESTARLLTSQLKPSGYQWHLYGDFDSQGDFQGFGMNISNYTNKMEIRTVGHMIDSRLEGFGAKQRDRDWGDGQIAHVWLGDYKDNNLNGLGGWTNGVSTINVGEWKDGKLEGIGYGSHMPDGVLYHEYYVGRYVDGDKQGWFDYQSINTFSQTHNARKEFDEGYLIDIDEGGSGIEFGQVFAIAAGAAIIGTADIDSASKAEIGGAFMADMIGSGNGSNMQALQQQYDTRTSITQPIGGASSTRSTGSSASNAGTGGKTGSAPSPAGNSGATGTASTSTTQQQPSQQPVGASGQPNQTGTSGASTRTAATPPAPATTPRAIQTASAPAATSTAPEPNRYVGAGRDYRYTGSSGTYYRQDLAVDLAKTNLRNQAAAFCNSTYKAEIRWGESHCKASRGAPDEYLCTIDAMVNCYVNPCDQAFCGTRD